MAGRVKASEIEAVKKLKYAIKRTRTGAVVWGNLGATTTSKSIGLAGGIVTAAAGATATLTATGNWVTIQNNTTNINILKQGVVDLYGVNKKWIAAFISAAGGATQWTIISAGASLKISGTTAGGASFSDVIATPIGAPHPLTDTLATLATFTWTYTPAYVTDAKSVPWNIIRARMREKVKVKGNNGGTVKISAGVPLPPALRLVGLGGTPWQRNELTTIMGNGTI